MRERSCISWFWSRPPRAPISSPCPDSAPIELDGAIEEEMRDSDEFPLAAARATGGLFRRSFTWTRKRITHSPHLSVSLTQTGYSRADQLQATVQQNIIKFHKKILHATKNQTFVAKSLSISAFPSWIQNKRRSCEDLNLSMYTWKAQTFTKLTANKETPDFWIASQNLKKDLQLFKNARILAIVAIGILQTKLATRCSPVHRGTPSPSWTRCRRGKWSDPGIEWSDTFDQSNYWMDQMPSIRATIWIRQTTSKPT